MSRLDILAELWSYLRIRKRYWLSPIIVMLVLLGALLFLVESSAVAPFIYTVF